MNTRIFALLHAALAVVLGCASLFGAASATSVGGRNTVTLGLVLALAFGLATIGYRVRSRLLVAIPTILVLAVAGIFSFVMLFSPPAWGESTMRAVHIFQGVLLLVMVLEVAGLVLIFRKGKAGEAGQAG